MTIALVTGGREYRDRESVNHFLDAEHAKRRFTHVITGGAAGADLLAHEWALSRGVQTVQCVANWAKHGKAAGPLRNAAMAALGPDIVYAFPGSTGTEDMVTRAMEAGIRVVRL